MKLGGKKKISRFFLKNFKLLFWAGLLQPSPAQPAAMAGQQLTMRSAMRSHVPFILMERIFLEKEALLTRLMTGFVLQIV